jgi:hypothetical protein
MSPAKRTAQPVAIAAILGLTAAVMGRAARGPYADDSIAKDLAAGALVLVSALGIKWALEPEPGDA